jgi:hypothetical protein
MEKIINILEHTSAHLLGIIKIGRVCTVRIAVRSGHTVVGYIRELFIVASIACGYLPSCQVRT